MGQQETRWQMNALLQQARESAAAAAVDLPLPNCDDSPATERAEIVRALFEVHQTLVCCEGSTVVGSATVGFHHGVRARPSPTPRRSILATHVLHNVSLAEAA